MHRNARVAAFAAAVTVGAFTLAGTAPAFADDDMLTDDQESAIRVNMTEGGINAATQDALVEKMEAGVAPDSLSGEEPVDTITQLQTHGTRTIKVFADGSRSWSDVQTAPRKSSKTPSASIDGCQNSGGWKVGCRVGIYDIISSATFVIDYQTSASGQAKVRDMRSLACANVAGPCSRSGSIKRATQSSAGPAWAELSYSASAAWVSVSGAFGIRVSGNSVTTY
jgi:hypothetical protein